MVVSCLISSIDEHKDLCGLLQKPYFGHIDSTKWQCAQTFIQLYLNMFAWWTQVGFSVRSGGGVVVLILEL